MFTCYKITSFSSVLIHNYTTVQKFGVNKFLLNYFIQQGSITLIENDSKDLKDVFKNKCCSFELSIHQKVIKNVSMFS